MNDIINTLKNYYSQSQVNTLNVQGLFSTEKQSFYCDYIETTIMYRGCMNFINMFIH